MKLLIAFHSLSKLAGGVDNRLSQLECALPESIEREYLLFKDAVTLEHKGKINFIPPLYIPEWILKYKRGLKPLAYLYGYINLFRRVYLTRQFLKQHHFNTILAVDDYFSLVLILASVGMNIKIISSVRNNWKRLYNNTMVHLLPDFMYKRLLPALMNRYVKHVHAVSEGLTHNLSKEFGVKNVSHIYNIFDFKAIDKASALEVDDMPTEKYIVCVGHLNDQKNHIDLLQSYALMKSKGLNEKLVFIGDGPRKKALEDLSMSLGIHEDVYFLGKKSNPYPYMRAAKYYFSTSLYEGLPAVLVESLFLNVPFFSYDCDFGPSELSQNVTKMTPKDFSDIVWGLLQNHDNVTRTLEKERKQMLETFHQDYILQRWIELL